MVQQEHVVAEYPSPLFAHGEVCRDGNLFLGTLQQFHNSLGTKFWVPKIGGENMDLHLLYIQVTMRGGIVKVVIEKRWRDVIANFSFPVSITNASHVMRKHYVRLLYHYEQVYFFRAKGSIIAPPAVLQRKCYASATLTPAGNGVAPALTLSPQASSSNAVASAPTDDDVAPASGTCSVTVSGTIDAKFDYGYAVTISVNGQYMHGVIYPAVATPEQQQCDAQAPAVTESVAVATPEQQQCDAQAPAVTESASNTSTP